MTLLARGACLALLLVAASACTPSRPTAATPLGPRPSPVDDATERDRSGARMREGIGDPKGGPERHPSPTIHTPPPASSGGAGGFGPMAPPS